MESQEQGEQGGKCRDAIYRVSGMGEMGKMGEIGRMRNQFQNPKSKIQNPKSKILGGWVDGWMGGWVDGWMGVLTADSCWGKFLKTGLA